MRHVTILLALAILATFSPPMRMHWGEEKEILETIGDVPEQICPNVPLEGSSSTVELYGSAKAELSGLFTCGFAGGIDAQGISTAHLIILVRAPTAYSVMANLGM